MLSSGSDEKNKDNKDNKDNKHNNSPNDAMASKPNKKLNDLILVAGKNNIIKNNNNKNNNNKNNNNKHNNNKNNSNNYINNNNLNNNSSDSMKSNGMTETKTSRGLKNPPNDAFFEAASTRNAAVGFNGDEMKTSTGNTKHLITSFTMKNHFGDSKNNANGYLKAKKVKKLNGASNFPANKNLPSNNHSHNPTHANLPVKGTNSATAETVSATTPKPQGVGKLEKKAKLEIPKNAFVKDQLFKSQLERIIANPVSPSKKSKSMSSLNDTDAPGKNKKYRFLVEGIDVPAKAPEKEKEEEEEADGKTKKEQKGFAYIKDKLQANEVARRAHEVAARRPHESVEHQAIEREILSSHQQPSALLASRDQLHAHIRSLQRKSSLEEGVAGSYVDVDVERTSLKQQVASTDFTNEYMSIDEGGVTLPEGGARDTKKFNVSASKSEVDLSRLVDEGRWNSLLSAGHSIPHDTSRVFLKPHEQDVKTLRQLKKQRVKYLKKEGSRGDADELDGEEIDAMAERVIDGFGGKGVDGLSGKLMDGFNERVMKVLNGGHLNPSDSSAAGSPLYKKSQNSTHSTEMKKKKSRMKDRSKHKQQRTNAQVSHSRTHAAAGEYANTGDDHAYTTRLSEQSQHLSLHHHPPLHHHHPLHHHYNIDGRGQTLSNKNGGLFVDDYVNTDYLDPRKPPFEDLRTIAYSRDPRANKLAENAFRHAYFHNESPAKHRNNLRQPHNSSDKLISGLISFPNANISKSLDDLYTEVSGRLTVQNPKTVRATKRTLKAPSGVRISGPGVFYNPLHGQDRFGSLPNFPRLEPAEPTKVATADLQRHQHSIHHNYNGHNYNSHNYNSHNYSSHSNNRRMQHDGLKNSVIWEEPVVADPELERVGRVGKLYRVQVKLNNTPMASRVGSSMSNKQHLLGPHVSDYSHSRSAFKSSNYIKHAQSTPLLPPSEMSSHSAQNHSISTGYLQPLSIIPPKEAPSSDLRSSLPDEDRFAVKSIKSSEPVPKSPPPNKIEFDLELLQASQPLNNNNNNNNSVVTHVSKSNNSNNKQQRHNDFPPPPPPPPRDFSERRSRVIKPSSSLLLVDNLYRDHDANTSHNQNIVKGSVLIKNPLTQKQGGHVSEDPDNLFGGHYFQARENPIYVSDLETLEARNARKVIASPNAPSIAHEWEETGGHQRTVPIRKQWYHDYVADRSSNIDVTTKTSGPWKLRSSQNRGACLS